MKKALHIILAFLGLNSCTDQNSIDKLTQYIKEVKGLTLIEKNEEKYIQLSDDFSVNELPNLLNVLKETKTKFEIYDELYGSSSDPGAYICYSQEKVKSDSGWSMTLGNHGWSGGIYQISDSTILIQLSDLIKKHKLKEIQLTNAVFFAHYDSEKSESNNEMNTRIRTIHCTK
ncbi:MAG: hypothetical protein V4511_04015 [Bacteroidota bacterium]